MSDLPTDWDPKPWWRTLSLLGWLLLALAVFATLSFVAGVLTGETLVLLSFKAKSGPVEFSWEQSPGWFTVAMLVNALVAVGVWLAFAGWLKERRSVLREPPLPRERGK
jgi:hypothetical protein